MTKGPFKPSFFDKCIKDDELENLPFRNVGIRGERKDQCRIFSDAANTHPFVKDTELLVKTIYDENKDPGLDAALSAFLSKYFPKEGE